MFLKSYGLKEQPFGVTPDPRYLYQSLVHREALASLVYGIESGLGFASLIAPPGLGKTTLLYYLLSRYRTSARTAFIFETQCRSHELLRQILVELDIPAANDDPVTARTLFKDFLVAQARAGRRVLIIIDEAQNLGPRALETVRLLSNFETSQAKLLQILLAGQPQLEEKLARPDLHQLRQRISMFAHLSPFTPQEVQSYIEHRLAVAGYSGGPLFTADAYSLIARETRGIPREINRVCFNALSLGCALEKRILDGAIIRDVLADLKITPDQASFLTPARPADAGESKPKPGWNRNANTDCAHPSHPIEPADASATGSRVDGSVTAPTAHAKTPAGGALSGTAAPLLAARDVDELAQRLVKTLSHQLLLEIQTGVPGPATSPLNRSAEAPGTEQTASHTALPASPASKNCSPQRSTAGGSAIAASGWAGLGPIAAAADELAAHFAEPMTDERAALKIALYGVLCPLLIFFLVYLLAHVQWLSQAITMNR